MERALLCLEGLSLGDAFGESFFTSDASQRVESRRLRPGLWRWTLVVATEYAPPEGSRTRLAVFSTRTGHRVRTLTAGHDDHTPSFSPDGRRWCEPVAAACIRSPPCRASAVLASGFVDLSG